MNKLYKNCAITCQMLYFTTNNTWISHEISVLKKMSGRKMFEFLAGNSEQKVKCFFKNRLFCTYHVYISPLSKNAPLGALYMDIGGISAVSGFRG